MKYLDRSLMQGPYLALCKSEKEFQKEMKKLKIQDPPIWLPESAHACTNTFYYNGKVVCIVSIRPYRTRKQVEINALLVHEAVHVWQKAVELMGEKNPGDEQEAYAIQNISQNLMQAFWAK